MSERDEYQFAEKIRKLPRRLDQGHLTATGPARMNPHLLDEIRKGRGPMNAIVPICPKCHELISEKRFERHLRRCGISHKDEAAGLYVPSATPPWEGVQRGILVNPPRKKKMKSLGSC